MNDMDALIGKIKSLPEPTQDMGQSDDEYYVELCRFWTTIEDVETLIENHFNKL